MSKKVLDAEIVMILYKEGLNDREIATAFNCHNVTVHNWRKKHNLIHNYKPSDYKTSFKKEHAPFALKKKRCLRCKKLFIPKIGVQKYCNNPCISPKEWESKQRFYLIRDIRFRYSKLVKSNPLKAEELKDEMLKKEGKDFADMALDGVFENEVFSDEALINRFRILKWKENLKKS